MKKESYDLFEKGTKEEIVEVLNTELSRRNESPIWREKVAPFSSAILSVLIPLRERGMLQDPQGVKQEVLTPELFLEWSDFVSLKMLMFQIAKANGVGEKFEGIAVDELASYLARYSVDLEDEMKDFPIANYNLHQGVSSVIKSLL